MTFILNVIMNLSLVKASASSLIAGTSNKYDYDYKKERFS
jgi:hypothetical protein